jgi:hypothetical protein
LDSAAEHLALTEAQQERYEEIRQEIRSSLTEGGEERKRFFDELRGEIQNEEPDMDVVVALVKGQLEDIRSFMEKHVDLFAELYSILDETQKAHVLQKIRHRMGDNWPIDRS